MIRPRSTLQGSHVNIRGTRIKPCQGRNALQLYGSLTSDQTAILFQARTEQCRLPVPLEERLSRVHNILHIMSEHLGAIQLTFRHGYSDIRGGIPCVDLSMVAVVSNSGLTPTLTRLEAVARASSSSVLARNSTIRAILGG